MKTQTVKRVLTVAMVAVLSIKLTGCASTGGNEPDASASAAPMTVEDTVRAGDAAARRGNLERALILFLGAIDTMESADVWFRVGAICTQLGRSDRALRAYLRVIELDPSHIGAQEGAGLESMALGRDQAARDHLLETIALDELRWRAHNGLGVLADQTGSHNSAIAHYLAAREINHDSPMVLNNLGYSRYLSGDFDQAARDFYEATQLRADYTPAWSNLGMVYAQRAWYFDAVTILSRVMDKATAYNDVGYVAFRSGDLFEAEHMLAEAIRSILLSLDSP